MLISIKQVNFQVLEQEKNKIFLYPILDKNHGFFKGFEIIV